LYEAAVCCIIYTVREKRAAGKDVSSVPDRIKNKTGGVSMENLINKKMEDFTVDAYRNGEFIKVTAEDFRKGWSVLVFYPADFTFVCPTELKDLQDHYAEFKKAGCEVYSCSEDSHFVHKAWAASSDSIKTVEYPMLADPAGVLARMFGVLVPEAGQALRGSFVINPRGEIKAYEIHDMGIGRNAEELLRKVEAAQFVEAHGDQVCPAHWKPGEETLKPSFDLVGAL
jgi:peroxiredoxin